MGIICRRTKVGRGIEIKEDQENINIVLEMEWVSFYCGNSIWLLLVLFFNPCAFHNLFHCSRPWKCTINSCCWSIKVTSWTQNARWNTWLRNWTRSASCPCFELARFDTTRGIVFSSIMWSDVLVMVLVLIWVPMRVRLSQHGFVGLLNYAFNLWKRVLVVKYMPILRLLGWEI